MPVSATNFRASSGSVRKSALPSFNVPSLPSSASTDAPVRRRKVRLNTVVQKAIERARRDHPHAGDRLHSALDPTASQVAGDPNLLEEALAAVLANALQAIEDNGGTVTVTTSRGEGVVEVVVADTGRGMSAEEVERALDPFFTTREAGQGMGLGLSISYAIIKRHGGEMTLESIPGRGTTVRMSLPAPGARLLSHGAVRRPGGLKDS